MPNELSPLIKSPCILICTMDPETDLCLGCGRSSREIANWTGYSDAERADIMRGLSKRMKDAKAKSGGAA